MATLIQIHGLIRRFEESELRNRMAAAIVIAAVGVSNEAAPGAQATEAERARYQVRQQWARDTMSSRGLAEIAAGGLLWRAAADAAIADMLVANTPVADEAIQAFVDANLSKIMPLAAA